jgi:hypothetical protein
LLAMSEAARRIAKPAAAHDVLARVTGTSRP